MEVALTPELEKLITTQVENGNYPSRGEVVRDALRLLQEHLEVQEKRLESLRRDVAVGLEALERGEYDDFETDDIPRLAAEVKARGRDRLRARARTSVG